jgi:hypothetical protein
MVTPRSHPQAAAPLLNGGPIPLVDLAAQHSEVAGEIDAGFTRIMQGSGFIGGPEVAGF